MSKAKPDMWADVDTARAELSIKSEVPSGVGFTSRQYAERYRLNYRTCYDDIKRLLQAGKIRVVGKRGKCTVYDKP